VAFALATNASQLLHASAAINDVLHRADTKLPAKRIERCWVECQADVPNLLRRSGAAGHDAVESLTEFVGVNRFGEEIVHVGFDAGRLIRTERICRHRNNRYGAELAAPPEVPDRQVQSLVRAFSAIKSARLRTKIVASLKP
jgi:hypothetical protein